VQRILFDTSVYVRSLRLQRDDLLSTARLTNDTLIAVSAARNGTRILTANPKDFARISEFRKFEWEMLSGI